MFLLPIVGRELRVATRRRMTYWNRSITVVVATIITIYMLASMGRLVGPAQAGANLFSVLTRLAFLGCLFAGVFFTADSLSEERREGTLGLLFLTDLKNYDVVLGKLIATSMNAFFGLLSLFPVLALPLVMGGVTPGEFARATLALANTLLFSLAVGMAVSSISWQERKTMLLTAGLLVLCGAVLPAMGGPLQWASPRTAFQLAADAPFRAAPASFGWALLAIQGFSWALLLFACRKARRAWQWEKGLSKSKVQHGAAGEPSPVANISEAPRRPLLERNPMEWLAMRKASNAWVWSSLAVLALAWFVVCFNESGVSMGSFVESFSILVSSHALLKFWVAWEATRRFFDHRRDGTLESLLSTPLGITDVVHGQFNALVKQFFRPLGVVLTLDLLLMSWLASSPILASISSDATWLAFVMLVIMALLVADAFALAWLGLWLGLKAKKSWVSAFGALARIILLPTCIFFVFAMFMGWGTGSVRSPTALVILWALIGGANALFFGFTSYWKLHTHFRVIATQGSVAALPPPKAEPRVETPQLEEYYSLLSD